MAKTKQKKTESVDSLNTKKVLDDKKLNIMLLGNSGAGKSTLINAFLDTDIEKAEVGMGEAITKEIKVYGEESGLDFRLIDTPGLEYNKKKQNSLAKNLNKWMKNSVRTADPKSIVHIIWFCVDGSSAKLPKETLDHLKTVSSFWNNVPILIVVTKAYFEEDKNANIAMVEGIIEKYGKDAFNIKEIIPVVAQQKEDVPSMGLEKLLKATEKYGPEAKNIFEKMWRIKTCVKKRADAQKIVFISAALAMATDAAKKNGGVGKVVTPIQQEMLEKIAKIYEIESKDTIKTVAEKLIASNAVGAAGKKIADKAVYIFKRKAKIAAKVITSSVSGTVTVALGEIGIIIFEGIYRGDIDASNTDWDKYIDKLLKDKKLSERIKGLKDAIVSRDADEVIDSLANLVDDHPEEKKNRQTKTGKK